MKTNSILTAILRLALCCAITFITCSTLLAQVVEYGDPRPETKSKKPTGITASAMSGGPQSASAHNGLSPWPTPTPTDSQFVVDTSSGLDTQCQFRGEGSLKFTIDVTRVVGSGDTGAVDGEGKLVNPQQMVNNGVISPTAILTMPAFDVDFNAATSGSDRPERDRILFNGQSIGNLGSERYLLGDNNKWRMNLIQVPISMVKFAKENGLSPIPGHNEIEILIDQANIANNKELWCTAIDWASLKFKAIYPVVMIHGNGSSGAFWTNLNFTQPFREQGIPYYNDINLPTDYIIVNTGGLASLIPTVLLRFGIKHIHVVCHSKGGLDTRSYLKLLPTQDAPMAFMSMITLSTPHHGSALADYLRDSRGANALLSDAPTRVAAAQYDGDYNRGRQNLTTEFVARFNNSNLPLPKSFVVQGEKNDVQYFTIGADANADDSFFLGRPTITPSELAHTGHDEEYKIAQIVGGTLVYRIIYDVASTHYEDITILGKQYRVVRETLNATGEVNDMLVTVTSSKLEPTFNTLPFNPPLKRNHATVGDQEMGEVVRSLIKGIQPVQW